MIRTPYEIFEQDPEVITRIKGVSSKRQAFKNLEAFYVWLQDTPEFRGLTPSELLHYPDKKAIERTLETYIIELKDQGLRLKTLMTYYARVRGFFTSAMEPLPRNPAFTKSLKMNVETEPVENNLTPIFIRRVLDTLKPHHKAGIISMFQGCMDRARFDYWNKTGYADLMKALENDPSEVMISFKGRKSNTSKFFTFIGRDSIKALKEYINRG